MARVNLLTPEQLTGSAKEAYNKLAENNKVTNVDWYVNTSFGIRL